MFIKIAQRPHREEEEEEGRATDEKRKRWTTGRTSFGMVPCASGEFRTACSVGTGWLWGCVRWGRKSLTDKVRLCTAPKVRSSDMFSIEHRQLRVGDWK